MDFFIRLIGNNLIHKIQKLPTPATGVVASLNHTSGHIQCRKQGSCAMALILVTKSPNCLTIRKAQPALVTFQSLDGRFLVNTDDKGILRWFKIKAYNISGLLGKLWVCAHTPTPA